MAKESNMQRQYVPPKLNSLGENNKVPSYGSQDIRELGKMKDWANLIGRRRIHLLWDQNPPALLVMLTSNKS